VDEIIHLGDFWNEAGMRKNREIIIQTNKEAGKLFSRAYRYLKAALELYEDNAVIKSWAVDNAKANILADEIMEELFLGTAAAQKTGKLRCLFASAITPDGCKNHLDTILNTKKIISLNGFPGAGTEKLLEKVKNAALERGFNIEAFYCALRPEKLEHLVIPGLETSLTTVNGYHDADVCINMELDFTYMADEKLLMDYKSDLEYNQVEFDELLGKAIETISKAKKMHDLMEKYYIPNMDFEAVQRCWESTMCRILEYAE
jgi:hypothetical protein